MKLICEKCGSTAFSKCPAVRTIFPSQEGQEESNFWHGMGFALKGGKLSVTMATLLDEEGAMTYLINKLRQIPEDKIPLYVCKHQYTHTEDCSYCGFKP